MLNPNDRKVYLQELRPLEGYELDRALATTFSLDLISLLGAPVAMAFGECDDWDQVLKDPIAALEAIRRTRDRFAVFCQHGRIAVPQADSRLFSYLEQAVVEVRAPFGGAFHPKIWLLRYKSSGQSLPVRYRFLCLSRNLTRDRSWDTVLTLEGELKARKNGFGQNRPLADFLKALPQMAVHSVPRAVQEHVALMAEEVRRVEFELPQDVSDFAFHPSGIPGYRRPPALTEQHRLLVVSPFVSVEGLAPLAEYGNQNILVARVEELDALPEGKLAEVESRTTLYVLDDQAEQPDPEESVSEDQIDLNHDCSGLHAKLYIAENGRDARVFTGSANVTAAAWSGQNVEFLVELKGSKRRIGIDQFVGTAVDQAFGSMLRAYKRPEAPSPEVTLRRQLEAVLDAARTALLEAGLRAEAARDGEGTYALTVKPARPFQLGAGVTGRCYPVSLKAPSALAVDPLTEGKSIRFPSLSVEGLTGFFAFALATTVSGQKAGITFILNLPVASLPADRDQRILHSIISDQDRFMRYLRFLLAEESDTHPLTTLLAQGEREGARASASRPGMREQTLLEELVRTYSRHPDKIEQIVRTVADLATPEEGRTPLPSGLLDLLAVFTAAGSRREARA